MQFTNHLKMHKYSEHLKLKRLNYFLNIHKIKTVESFVMILPADQSGKEIKCFFCFLPFSEGNDTWPLHFKPRFTVYFTIYFKIILIKIKGHIISSILLLQMN